MPAPVDPIAPPRINEVCAACASARSTANDDVDGACPRTVLPRDGLDRVDGLERVDDLGRVDGGILEDGAASFRAGAAAPRNAGDAGRCAKRAEALVPQDGELGDESGDA